MDYLFFVILPLVGACAGAFLGSYLRKWGELQAVHADLKNLLTQVSAVTQRTKEIEASISIDLWSRQQRWDLQRSALLDSLKELAHAEALLWSMVHVCTANDRSTQEGQKRCTDANDQYMKAINGFWRVQLAMAIVCGKEIGDQFEKIDRLMAIVRNKTTQGDTREIWGKYFTDVQVAKSELAAIIRKQLGFDPPTTSIPRPHG